jgi:hypothetical protein
MHGRRRGFDVMLRGRVDSLLGAVHGADPYGSLFLDVSELAPQAEDIYVAATASGIVGSSQQVPPNVLASIRASNASGFFNFEWKGQVYRAFHKEGVRSMDQESPGIRAQPIALLYATPTKDLEYEATQAYRYYATAAGFLLIVTGFVLIGSLRTLMKPLHELAKSARRVSMESWDFSPPFSARANSRPLPIRSRGSFWACSAPSNASASSPAMPLTSSRLQLLCSSRVCNF